MTATVQLITYVDRLGGDFQGLRKLLAGPLSGLFGGTHVLPFFYPIDGADAGFDPADHCRIDSRLGNWSDVSDLAADYSVMADLIVNHVSVDSPQFQDVREKGRASKYWPLFLKKSDIFPDGASERDLAAIYRPRPGAPFTPITLRDEETHEFWTTFSPQQLDIDAQSEAGQSYLRTIIDKFAAAGIREIRLDAAGYTIKKPGTRCFMLDDTVSFIQSLSQMAARRGIQTLVELHTHYSTQIELAEKGERVYDFALPPLVLHTLYKADSAALRHWLKIAPRNCVTVLDTHDGIGIIDVAQDGERPGLLSSDDIQSLVEEIHQSTGGSSRAASGHSAANLDIYQINSTYYDALRGSDDAYLIARAIQLFVPGTPQIYYVGLLAGSNDLELMRRTGVGRDINRHYYNREEIEQALERRVVRDLFELIRLRNSSPAFSGEFEVLDSPGSELHLSWKNGNTSIQLVVDLAGPSARIIESRGATSNSWLVSDGLRQTA